MFYIYARTNDWYKQHGVVKVGVTENVWARNAPYVTCEVMRGEMLFVAKVVTPVARAMHVIDAYLKHKSESFRVYFGGGTEFYRTDIIDKIPSFLDALNVSYSVLDDMTRCINTDALRAVVERLNVDAFISRLRAHRARVLAMREPKCGPHTECAAQYLCDPLPHQQSVLNHINTFYTENDIGTLQWACGLGKTLCALFICHKLSVRNVLVGVPSVFLQSQFADDVRRVFPSAHVLLHPRDRIRQMRKRNSGVRFVITTYQSCHALTGMSFDMKIGDECHHLAGHSASSMSWRRFHDICSKKTLMMTATSREMTELKPNADAPTLYTMDDERFFGKVIDCKSFKWAIYNKKITDYVVCVVGNTAAELSACMTRTMANQACDPEIFLACWMCVQAFSMHARGESVTMTHTLLYTNTVHDAKKAYMYLCRICITLDVHVSCLTSDDSPDKVRTAIREFTDATYGIICCVYLFGEGFSLPAIDSVCIACNMRSETRIVQYTMRANRLDARRPDKVATYLIPYIDSSDWRECANGDRSFDKVKHVIYRLANEDEHIEQRIQATLARSATTSTTCCDDVAAADGYCTLGALDALKIRLRRSQSLAASNLQLALDEYELYRDVNRRFGFSTRKAYFDVRDTYDMCAANTYGLPFIDDIDRHFLELKKKHGDKLTWYSFLCVDTSGLIACHDEWRRFCNEHGITAETYYAHIDAYPQLPREPTCMWPDIANLTDELRVIHRRRK